MKKGFYAVVLAAGLAGCGATPTQYRNEKELPLPPGEGAFGSSFTWEWRKKDEAPQTPAVTAPAAAATVSEAEEFKKWKESASRSERQDFEEWRAWQEWKRKNPK